MSGFNANLGIWFWKPTEPICGIGLRQQLCLEIELMGEDIVVAMRIGSC